MIQNCHKNVKLDVSLCQGKVKRKKEKSEERSEGRSIVNKFIIIMFILKKEVFFQYFLEIVNTVDF